MRPQPGAQHGIERDLRAMENAVDVDVHGALPVSEIQPMKGCRWCHAGGVHQYFNIAEPFSCSRKSGGYAGPVCDVARDCVAALRPATPPARLAVRGVAPEA